MNNPFKASGKEFKLRTVPIVGYYFFSSHVDQHRFW